MDEWLYSVDMQDNVLKKVRFSDAHSNKNIIHRAAHVFIFNNRGNILLQKRSRGMANYPGFWESSASGHVDYGESYLDAAVRELKEEIEIVAGLEEFGKFLVYDKNQTEMIALFIGHHDGPFRPSKDEVSEVKFFPVSEIKDMVQKGKCTKAMSILFEEYNKN